MGHVINLHAFGGTVRLEDGTLAALAKSEVELHRGRYEQSLGARVRVPFEVVTFGRGKLASLARGTHDPVLAVPTAPAVPLTDQVFEERLAAYLRETEEWAPPDKPQPFERHLTQKRRRTAQFLRES